mgnify:CR=1 FL=1
MRLMPMNPVPPVTNAVLAMLARRRFYHRKLGTLGGERVTR